MLTQKRLCEVLNYSPTTGVFTWTKGRRKGKVAGTSHDERGLLKVAIDGERHLLHRLAWLWMKGTMCRWSVEHVNSDHTDNRWANLREGDRGQKKQHRPPRRHETGIPGVSKVGDVFDAMVEVQGRVFNLGSFATEAEAGAAVTVALKRAQRRLVRGRVEA